MDSEALRRADDAAGVLASEAFQEAVEAVRDALIAEWRTSKRNDTQTRERAWQMTVLLDSLVANLESYVADGHLERDRLTQTETAKPWNLEAWRRLV